MQSARQASAALCTLLLLYPRVALRKGRNRCFHEPSSLRLCSSSPPLTEFRFPNKTRQRNSCDGHQPSPLPSPGCSKELCFSSIPLGFLHISLSLQHLDKPYCEQPGEERLKSPSASTSTSKSPSAAQEPQKPFPGPVPWLAGTGRGQAQYPLCPLSLGAPLRAVTTLRLGGTQSGQCQRASFVFFSLKTSP